MSHLLHDYVADQLSGRLVERRIVVWYDPRSEFESFIGELNVGDDVSVLTPTVANGVEVAVARFDGSMYALRAVVEPLVAGDDPEPLLIYLAGVERDSESPLMELETGGSRWEPQLRQLARNALRKKFTDGVIDDLLGRDNITYDDIALASKSGEQAPSILKTILAGSTSEAQLAHWLADPDLDAAIAEKGAAEELRKLVAARLKLGLEDEDVPKWRAITSRFVLAVEFRADLAADAPRELASLPATIIETEQRARSIADRLRTTHQDVYPELADRVEHELGLGQGSVDPLALGAIDTFRFEEGALLTRCADLIQAGDYDRVLQMAEERQGSFWLANDVERQAQWRALRLAAELGMEAHRVDEALAASKPTSVAVWIESYADTWEQMDRAQRKLEAWLPKLDDEPDERAIAAVRRRYEEVLTKLSSGYVTALEATGWDTDGVLQQTSIFDDLVRPHTGRVAYFLVDAMRYEMGAELAERLADHGEVTIQPAAGVLPSITTTGMAALMPDASAAYDVLETKGKLQAKVDGTLLPDLNARKKHVAARVPSSVDFDLGEVLQLSRTKLQNKVGQSELIMVRSQEIDFFGEGGFGFQARSVMDTVIDNLARAVRKLAAIGVERAVIASDHGHLFAAEAKDDSMKIEAPGGDKLELHRRCWIGRGGATPSSCVRIAARSLGNDSDLDFVFPANCGVFKAGGDLAFHHGGPTLQEMVIPVLTFRSASLPESTGGAAQISVAETPAAITNRMFTIKVLPASLLGGDKPVLPILVSDGRQVGSAGMVLGAELLDSGEVALQPGVDATIGFMLSDDKVAALRIVVLDPTTDAELYRSPADIPVNLGVA